MASPAEVELQLAEGAVSVDATLIAKELGLEPARVLDALRNGQITALCEQGMGEDAGRFRLTFRHRGRRLRIVVDSEGRIIERSATTLRRRLRPVPGDRSQSP